MGCHLGTALDAYLMHVILSMLGHVHLLLQGRTKDGIDGTI